MNQPVGRPRKAITLKAISVRLHPDELYELRTISDNYGKSLRKLIKMYREIRMIEQNVRIVLDSARETLKSIPDTIKGTEWEGSYKQGVLNSVLNRLEEILEQETSDEPYIEKALK